MTEPIAMIPGGHPLPAPGQGERRRIGGLDVLRGLAALAVLIYHYGYNYQRLFHGNVSFPPLKYGALGVQLFFIISGFVIFMTLEKTRRPIDFVRSRFARLYPAYWAAVILTFLVLTVFKLPELPGVDHHKFHPTLLRGLLNLTMCQEMFGIGHIDAVYWTLQLELCFYFIMFVLFVTRQIARVEIYLLALLGLGEILIRVSTSHAYLHLVQQHHAIGMIFTDLQLLTVTSMDGGPHCRLHGFIIGIAIYKLATRFHPRHLITLGIMLAYACWREYHPTAVVFYCTLAFTALVYAAARGWLWPLENRVTLFLGAISYSLYLTHQDIGYEIIRAMERRGVSKYLAIAVAGAIAVAIATALTYCIEQPALRLLRGKKPSRVKTP